MDKTVEINVTKEQSNGDERYRKGVITGVVWTLAAIGAAVIISYVRS